MPFLCKGTHTQHQTATLRWHNEIYNYNSWHLWLSYTCFFWGFQWPRKLIRNNPLKPWDVRFVISMKGGSWLSRHQVGGSHVVFYCQYIVYHLLLARILPLSRPKSFQHSLNKVGPSCYLATILHNDSTALSRTFQQCCHFTRRIGLGNAWKLHQKTRTKMNWQTVRSSNKRKKPNNSLFPSIRKELADSFSFFKTQLCFFWCCPIIACN